MARIIPKQSFLNDLLTYVPSRAEEELVAIGGKAARAKILYDRNYRGFQKDELSNRGDYEFEPTYNRREVPAEYQKQILSSRGEEGFNNRAQIGSYTHEPAGSKTQRQFARDYVSIIDIDYKTERDEEVRRYSYIRLPFVPTNLSYNPKSEFVGIASFGRNNPYYHYSGSEDILKFTIDWFSATNSRTDVIFYCRWLEALSKANGYEDVPHRIKLSWGIDNVLFDNMVWIVESAPYEMSNFIDGYEKDGTVTKVGLLPQQAYQTVTLKKITDHNLNTAEIIGYNEIIQ